MVKLRVRELAEAQGLNIQELAKRSGIAYSSALDLWYDRVQRIDKKTIGRVAKALGVRPGELFGEEEEPGVWLPTFAAAV
jgi:transcriptional regulator with XRE-family HTH domain